MIPSGTEFGREAGVFGDLARRRCRSIRSGFPPFGEPDRIIRTGRDSERLAFGVAIANSVILSVTGLIMPILPTPILGEPEVAVGAEGDAEGLGIRRRNLEFRDRVGLGLMVPILSAPNSVNQMLPPGPARHSVGSGGRSARNTGIRRRVASSRRDSRRSKYGRVDRARSALGRRISPREERRNRPCVKASCSSLYPHG